MGCCNSAANTIHEETIEEIVQNSSIQSIEKPPPIIDDNTEIIYESQPERQPDPEPEPEPKSDENENNESEASMNKHEAEPQQTEEQQQEEQKEEEAKQEFKSSPNIQIMITKPTTSSISNEDKLRISDNIEIDEYSPIVDRIDLDADDDIFEQQIKAEQEELEQKFENEHKKHIRTKTFNVQLKQHQSQKKFDSLYEIWQRFATNVEKTKMNIKSLTSALTVFGIIIDEDISLQKYIWKCFDSDNNRRYIDYNDFSSTMSSIVASKTDDALLLLFKCFDIDQDDLLEIEDIARILLTQNQIALITTGLQNDLINVVYSKKQCLKQSKKMIKKHMKKNTLKPGNIMNDAIDENIKITFNEFKSIMMNRTDYDMIIDHMEQPSFSCNIDAPRVSIL